MLVAYFVYKHHCILNLFQYPNKNEYIKKKYVGLLFLSPFIMDQLEEILRDKNSGCLQINGTETFHGHSMFLLHYFLVCTLICLQSEII